MEKLYSVKEVCDIIGITGQTLRFYDKHDLLKPYYINESNGYRYYSWTQFSAIDKLKYMQQLGFSLKAIKAILDRDDVPLMLEEINRISDQLELEEERIRREREGIQWYRDFMADGISGKEEYLACVKHMPDRYLLSVPTNGGFDREARRMV